MTYAVLQAVATPAPTAPQAPSAPKVTITVPGANGAVHTYTTADIDALRARKEVLSRQMHSADSRRREVQRSLKGAVGADKAGLEQRLGVLDARIARLEQEIDENSSQLASLDVARVSGASTGPRWSPDAGARLSMNAVPVAIVFVLFVLSPLALSLSRAIWKRGAQPYAAPAHPDTTARLERMEQAIESIAIEIERVSEGQRFVTRVMSESRAGMLAEGQAPMEPVRLAENRVSETR